MDHDFTHLTQHISYTALIFLLGIIIGVVLHVFVPWEFTSHTLRAITLGWIFLIAGPALLFWSDESRATCYHQDEPGHVCKALGHGPYAYTRHPKYVAFMFLFVGLGLILNSIVMFIICAAIFLLFTFYIIPREERILMTEFSNYDEYRGKVSMWL